MSISSPGSFRVQKAPVDPALIFNELRPFLEQLGTPETLNCVNTSATALLRTTATLAALKQFLAAYKTEVLLPCEWPTIFRAYEHTRRNEARELVELDREFSGKHSLEKFRPASRRIGQWQLNQLGPLRGERVVSKYRAAVEDGRADAWHTIVYGLTLAVYSFPLRQGLMNFAMQVLSGYARSAAQALALSDENYQEILDDLLADLPSHLEQLLSRIPGDRIG